MKVNERIWIEKKPGFTTEAEELKNELKENLHISVNNLRYFALYDVFNIEETLLKDAKKTVFSEVMVDSESEPCLEGKSYVAYESLPGQYDQRADAAMQCIRLLDPKDTCTVTTGKAVVFDEVLTDDQLKAIENYLINPIESRVKDLSKMEIDRNVDVTPLEVYPGFVDYSDEQLNQFIQDKGLAMSFDDIKLVQAYFKEEGRDPRETEVRVLDTYWSDHCRHTTFETELTSIEFHSELFNDELQAAYNRYLGMRETAERTHKPQTLMDMGTINTKYLMHEGFLQDVEVSDEINACSVFIDVDHNGETEKWLLQFKNETHNHPTEIEPFGGASTCIGGAIRDPLSGRAYVYQAMRVTGSGDILKPLNETLEGKLPQRIISKKSARGNSSYGNQIGLPTTYVKEIYHDDYVAKHLEVGAVVGAVKAECVKRLKPNPGDVIILLGGKTGRDGIGGATGSSKEHTTTSLEKCTSEVQKGNAPEERKIQRLFRNPECASMIKKCNDFGAGGVSVAIGELADGLMIDLNKVRTKYAGLNATELAISESQERMAVVVTKEDKDAFIKMAEAENLEAYQVAYVTEEPRLIMTYQGETVVDIKRSFIDSAGARQHVAVNVVDSGVASPFGSVEVTKDNIVAMLKDKNVACQKGLVEMFDASIGSTTVMMPFGGKYQLTPTQASVQKLPVLDGKTDTCSVLTYGFDPKIMKYSPFIGSQYSVLSSMAKTVACGGVLDNVYFSFQEYFEKLLKEPERWGKVTQALLGAIKVLDSFNKASIGGKDSMSGTFNQYHVPPTLISFACSKGSVSNIITPEFKQCGNTLGVYLPKMNEKGVPDLDSYKAVFKAVEEGIKNKTIKSAYVVENGGILASLFKMSFGTGLGFDVNNELLLNYIPAAIVVETESELTDAEYTVLGKVTEMNYNINGIDMTYEEALNAWTSTFDEVYPRYKVNSKEIVKNADYVTDKVFKAKELRDDVHVLIPVFPGTNCEFDVARAFEEEGATAHIFVFRNLTEEAILNSIDEMAELMDKCQILALPGGFSSGDEPDGSAKFIVNVLQNEKIKSAVARLRDRDGLILGICNGFQALIKSGLLPYGEIKTMSDNDCTLYRNDINRHVSTMVTTRQVTNNSPWLAGATVGEVHSIAVSHGEGKFVCDEAHLKHLIENGMIAFQYCDLEGNATMDAKYCVNGSTYAIEGIVSEDGHVLGKMGHSERYVQGVFKNIEGLKKQGIFKNGVNYFKK